MSIYDEPTRSRNKAEEDWNLTYWDKEKGEYTTSSGETAADLQELFEWCYELEYGETYAEAQAREAQEYYEWLMEMAAEEAAKAKTQAA